MPEPVFSGTTKGRCWPSDFSRSPRATNSIRISKRTVIAFAMAIGSALSSFAGVLPNGTVSVALAADGTAEQADVRSRPLKDLNGYFPMKVPASRTEWEATAARIRRQVMVANGIWPMPTKTPLNAVVHGKVERPDYTVERVILETVPGHFLCGSLFRPKNASGKRPAVLSPHGHATDARFQDQSPATVKGLIATGAEKHEQGGRSIYQSRCVGLARMGVIVFMYDMEGNSDTLQLSHELVHRYAKRRPAMETAENWGFYSPQAESRLQSIMGLQTWNSIRALDFVTSLPDVDTTRIGVTGESGGGTQTMLLGAVDPRPTAIVPAVMVSTSMQGGCTCENCSLLRVGTGNIDFAGLFAPRPQALIAADDWTKEIMTKGMPELSRLYELLGAAGRIEAHAHLQFPHNYNYVNRAHMYTFFNREFGLKLPEPVIEADFQPLSRDELTVWTKDYPKPPGGDDHERALVRELTRDADRQIVALTPSDAATLAKYREVVGGGFDAIFRRRVEDVGEVSQTNLEETDRGGFLYYRCRLAAARHGEMVTTTYFYPKRWNEQVVVWATERGSEGLEANGNPIPAVETLIKAGFAVAGIDLIGQGKDAPNDLRGANRRVNNPREFAGFTYGYNDPVFVQRVNDLLTVVAHARSHQPAPKKIHLVGLAGAGPWVAAAAAQSGAAIDRLAVDSRGFRFAQLTDFLDPAFVPGVVKYGDLPALLALGAPHSLRLAGERELPAVVRAAYSAAGQPAAAQVVPASDATPEAIAEWLAKP
ncbi:MAG: acetylxylan esterase [Planctomycetota bacterium]